MTNMFDNVIKGSIAPTACCEEGTYWLQGSSICTRCTTGKYNNEAGSSAESACKDCASGKYNNEAGSSAESACKDCKPGTYNSEVGSNSSSSCKACSPGRYSSSQVPGQVSNKICVPCEIGKYNEHIKQFVCAECPLAYYNEEVGSNTSHACKRCPLGKNGRNKTTKVTGAASERECEESECAKSPAERFINGKCSLCPIGFYGDGQGESCVSATCHYQTIDNCEFKCIAY